MLLFTWPYNFEVCHRTRWPPKQSAQHRSKSQHSIKECLSGLAPDALCRIQSAWNSRFKIEFALTQSKSLSAHVSLCSVVYPQLWFDSMNF